MGGQNWNRNLGGIWKFSSAGEKKEGGLRKKNFSRKEKRRKRKEFRRSGMLKWSEKKNNFREKHNEKTENTVGQTHPFCKKGEKNSCI